VAAKVRVADNGSTPTWVRAIDGLVECGVYAFAAWTLFYELALVTQWSLWWPTRIWIVLVVGFVGWRAFAGLRNRRETPEPVQGPKPHPPESSVRWSQVGLVLAAAVVLVVLSALRQTLGVFPVVLASLVLLVAACAQTRIQARRHELYYAAQRVPQEANVVAALVCVGLAILASALRGSSDDDVYYVNRAMWVAQHGTPTLRDTVFSAGVLPTTYGNALPLA
jgi:uncharacterized membrane protein YidH (DUF202 family)